MQPASSTKPLLIVTIGIPGAGKSFFARRFSEMFSAPLISFDEIRYELFNDITHSEDENIIVARVAGLQLRELFKTHKTIIIDGGHNPKVSRTELAKVARAANYSTMYVWIQTDQKTAKERSTKRSNRREDDQFNRSLTPEEFDSQARKFTSPSKYETFMVISGRHTFASQAKIVLKNMLNPKKPASNDPALRPKQTNRDRKSISL